MSNKTNQTVEQVLREAGWIEDSIHNVNDGENYYNIDGKVLRAPRPESEYEPGDVRMVKWRDKDPEKAVYIKSADGSNGWQPVDRSLSNWWFGTFAYASDPSLVVMSEKPETPTSLTTDDLLANPGRVALDVDGDRWQYFENEGLFWFDAKEEPPEMNKAIELYDAGAPYHWADEEGAS